ncbi:uncharacterized protein E0L32_001594 [Thyridium curvatum]|uniref:Uncharacterized protein n=1 Tax=Thyridium curvatum TaxID=1093900 RepID=A0A507ARJ6_9PEZI|nr:uncharacterized protein E0L32_001594 [Thyridium curvatum]TPX09134.1 hypothetical protein E0L32_001594 [Thyridium curvatum]
MCHYYGKVNTEHIEADVFEDETLPCPVCHAWVRRVDRLWKMFTDELVSEKLLGKGRFSKAEIQALTERRNEATFYFPDFWNHFDELEKGQKDMFERCYRQALHQHLGWKTTGPVWEWRKHGNADLPNIYANLCAGAYVEEETGDERTRDDTPTGEEDRGRR